MTALLDNPDLTFVARTKFQRSDSRRRRRSVARPPRRGGINALRDFYMFDDFVSNHSRVADKKELDSMPTNNLA